MSILESATPAKGFLKDNFYWKVLLCGPTGTGKSTLATTLPGKKLVIDLDNRAASLAELGDVDVITIAESSNPEQPTAYDELYQLIDELWEAHDSDSLIYDSIIVDGLTALGRYSMNKILVWTNKSGKQMERGPGDSPAQPHYNPQMTIFSKAINRLLPLKRHVLFTAHYDLYEDKELNTLSYWPKVTGKLRTEVANWFNESYETKVEYRGGKATYSVYTFGSGRMAFVKSALNQLGKFWGNPIEVNFSDPPVGFQRLMAYRTGELKWEGELTTKLSNTTKIKI